MTIQDSTDEKRDGRHERSRRTRIEVAEAMLDCLEDGVLRPTAKEVAERAGVSTRAVFRHFDNMESLLEEVAELQIERVTPELPPLLDEGPLDARLDAFVTHCARRNEIVAPVRRSALLQEPFSDVIRKRHTWLRGNVRRQVRSVFAIELDALPESARRDRVAAIRALLSFSYWDELRVHERVSVAAATRILGDALRAQLCGGRPGQP